jgi:hypothetical protein
MEIAKFYGLILIVFYFENLTVEGKVYLEGSSEVNSAN